VTLISRVEVVCLISYSVVKEPGKYTNTCSLFLTCRAEGDDGGGADVVEGEERIVVREWSMGQMEME